MLRAIRRILRKRGPTPRRDVRRELIRLGYMTKAPADGLKFIGTLWTLQRAGEIEIADSILCPVDLGKTQPTCNRTLMPQVRKMLRQQPVWSRAAMRENLRARGHIGMCFYGGRRLYRALHDMADRGEVTLTPDTVTAIALLPLRSYAQAKPVRPLTTKRQAARERARKVAVRKTSGPVPDKQDAMNCPLDATRY